MTPAAADVAVLGTAAAADYASTRWALERCSSCREVNPWMREPATALLVKAGGVAAATGGCEVLRRRGHRRAARWLRWGVAALWLGLAAHNVRVGVTR